MKTATQKAMGRAVTDIQKIVDRLEDTANLDGLSAEEHHALRALMGKLISAKQDAREASQPKAYEPTNFERMMDA